MTRRDLVALGAAALFVAPSASAAEPDEAEILLRLIGLEEEAAAQDGPAASHERDHAAALRTLLDALGRQAPPGEAPAPSQDVVALETSLIEEYRAALLEIREPSILRTAATILASHSQHLVRARIDAGLDPFTSDP